MNDFDIAIVGAGVTGASVARTLSRYGLDVVLLEKECDVSLGTSKANSGIIHAGFHHDRKYLKTRLEVDGNVMFDRLRKELDFPFKRCGILVVAMKDEDMKYLSTLFEQGRENGAVGLEMCSRERTIELEPKIHPDVVGSLYAPAGGIIEPYRFVFALVESARKNGVELMTNFALQRAERTGEKWRLEAGDGRSVSASYVVNAAGLYADDVSRMFGAEEFSIRPRKGEYYLLDRMTKACPSRVLFPVPTQISKGMLVIPTVEGTVLIGPTAEDVDDKADVSTSVDQLDRIFEAARRMVPSVSENDVITSFSGLRPALDDGDFFLKVSEVVPGLVHAAGIQSPGLTAAPAIGEYVKDLLKEAGCTMIEKQRFDPNLQRLPRIRDLSAADVDSLATEDPRYAEIVCRCERVSEAEIREAIRRGHATLDGLKYFTRAGMGRCQGGFCTYRILKTIMDETGCTATEVRKRGAASAIITRQL